LKVRVIPTLLWKGFNLVKGQGFDSWRPVGAPLQAVKVYNTRDVDELMLFDITATLERRMADLAEIGSLTSECFVPLTVGGGVKNLETVKGMLRAGADKVSINSAAYEDMNRIEKTANAFGSQCVVASVDAKKNSQGYECLKASGSIPTGREPRQFCLELERAGAGEILLTSIERDGTMTGYDLELIRSVVDLVKIPVIASGGAGNYEHMLMALKAGASAVAASAMFQFTEQTPRAAKSYLSENGVKVRKS